MDRLRFGTPGIPNSTKPSNTVNGVKRVRELGLDAMELEFTYSVNVSEKMAPDVRKMAKANDIALTCHGQYFVNLAAVEEKKIHASINRMLSVARRLHECGGWSATWHAAFYLKRPKEAVYTMVKQNIKEVVKTLQDESNPVWVRPETTGKPTQWGDLQETIKLSQEVEQVLPCVDFSHLHARNGGGNNSTEEFRETLRQIEKGLGREALNNMHIHLSGIEYGPKGERRHLILEESDMQWQDLLKVWKEFKLKGVVTSESPNIEEDALLLQKTFANL